MSKHYLIDYESVRYFKDLVENNDESKQYLFYTDNCSNIIIDIVSEFKNMEFIKRKDSLDMCLSSYVGFLIGNNFDEEFIIVSKEYGYDDLIDFWSKRGVKISKIFPKPKQV